MSTPLSKIENGILNGDWELVCMGFNKLTGKNLQPPVKKETPKAFDPSKAKKTELYSALKELMGAELEPPKNYSIEELREMYMVHSISFDDYISVDTPEFNNLQKNTAAQKDFEVGKMLDGFRYTSGKRELLKADKRPIAAAPLEPQLAKVLDGEREYVPRDAPEKIMAKCIKCGKIYQTLKGLGVTLDGETKTHCANCQESL